MLHHSLVDNSLMEESQLKLRKINDIYEAAKWNNLEIDRLIDYQDKERCIFGSLNIWFWVWFYTKNQGSIIPSESKYNHTIMIRESLNTVNCGQLIQYRSEIHNPLCPKYNPISTIRVSLYNMNHIQLTQ